MWSSLIWLFNSLQYNFYIYFRTSSNAIYSRTVPLGDSNEYFDQIWFPSEPPGVALRGPLCCRRTTRESANRTPLHETVHDPADNPEFSRFQRAHKFPPPSPLVSRPVCGGWISSPAKGKLNSRWEILLLLRPPAPIRLPCHSSDVIKTTQDDSIIGHDSPFSRIKWAL